MSCSSSSGSEEENEGFDCYRKGGYHAVRIADTFASGRYVAQRKLGWGQFSTVWLAYDTQTQVCLLLSLFTFNYFNLITLLCFLLFKNVVDLYVLYIISVYCCNLRSLALCLCYYLNVFFLMYI